MKQLYDALEEIGLIPAHQWPVPDADLHRKLERLEADLEDAFVQEHADYRGNYGDGLDAGRNQVEDVLRGAVVGQFELGAQLSSQRADTEAERATMTEGVVHDPLIGEEACRYCCGTGIAGEAHTEETVEGTEKWDDVGKEATLPLVSESQIFWYGDNLTVMREHIASNSVDLIYLDPPFNSQRIYNRFFGELDGTESDAQRKAFDDYWRWGPEASRAFNEVVHPKERRSIVPASLSQTMEMLRSIHPDSNLLAYLSMMAVRLVEMRRALKPTGMLYLHCDPTASHYIKVLLDTLFTPTNFRNEIIWKRTGAHSSTRGFGPVHDTILAYAKTPDATCEPENSEYTEQYKERFNKIDEASGRPFQDVTLTGSGVRNGDSGKKWREHDPSAKGRHWAISGTIYESYQQMRGVDLKDYPLLQRLDMIHEAGLMYISERGRGGLPRYKWFLDAASGLRGQDVWVDIPAINSQAEERTDYPTQKPTALVERIIAASTRRGDVVLDPFCGCGTAVIAAERLGRKWIGIDITHVAVSVLKQRIQKEFPGLVYTVRGEPEDVASARRLAVERWDEFQAWIVDKVGGLPLNPTEEKKIAKKGKDGGVDGLFLFRDDPKAPRSHKMILSVKGGEHLNPGMVDALFGVVSRENARAGALLTAYPPTSGMKKTALSCGVYSSELFDPGKDYPKIQILSVEDIFDQRKLIFPGANTSQRSEPPVVAKGPAVAKAEEDLATFVLKASEPKKTKPKQQKLGLPAPQPVSDQPDASTPKRRGAPRG